MKKKSMMVILMGLMMFTSCSLSAANESQGTSVAVVAETKATDEVASDAQAANDAQVTTDGQSTKVTETGNDAQKTADAQNSVDGQSTNDAQTVAGAQVTGSEAVSYADRVLYKSQGTYTAYLTGKYSFAADGTTGTFSVSTFDSYSKEYVDSLKVGDTIQGGSIIWDEDGEVTHENIVIETLERDDAYNRIFINDGYCFVLQENGEYYFEDGAGFKNVKDAGEKTLKIASDVKIVDNADPYWSEGIIANYSGSDSFKNVAEFVDRLDDEDVWYQPELYLRVENDEVKAIAVNPANHEPWYGEMCEDIFED